MSRRPLGFARPQVKRNAEIYARYSAGGITLQALADEFGISRVRVWQIVERGGVTHKPGDHWARQRASNG